MRIHAEFEMGPYGKSKLRCQKCGQGILQHCKLKANGAVDTYCRRGTVGVHGGATIKVDLPIKSQIDTFRGTEPLGSRPGRSERAVNLQ
jgi:hypothetical protein